MPPTVFMFSGQGSQYYQMGLELFETNDTFRGCMLRLDDAARRTLGRPVVETLYSDAHRKSDPFDRIVLSNAAIFMVEYSLAQALMDAGVWPDMVLGVSMGSFAAAAVAGFLDAGDALSAVIRQAAAVEESCVAGGMIAVLADPALYGEEFLRGRGDVAAVNFDSHFVVTARQPELKEIAAELQSRNVSHQRLPVSFAFHSRWIDAARTPFVEAMRAVPRGRNRLPLICCDRTTAVSELTDDYLWDVVRHPIRFRETIARLEQQEPHRYIDAGPAGTLATFLKYGLPKDSRSTVQSILTPFGTDRKNLEAVSAAAFVH